MKRSVKTLLDTPEVEREVYGVIWDIDQSQPYDEYDSLDEAKEVAKATHGYLVARGVSAWVPVPAEAL